MLPKKALASLKISSKAETLNNNLGKHSDLIFLWLDIILILPSWIYFVKKSKPFFMCIKKNELFT